MENSSSIQHNHVRYRLLFPTHFKAFIVILILFLSWSSGAAQAAEYKYNEPVFVKQLSDTHPAVRYQRPISSGDLEQVAVLEVARKKIVIPTSTPSPIKGQSSAQAVQNSTNPFFQVLNAYREKNGKAALQWDDKLAKYAQERAELFNKQGALDQHAGFKELISSTEGFKKLGFFALGENSGYGHTADAASIIENVYGKSEQHNQNQLSSEWTHVGIGVSGTATNFVFGGRQVINK